MKGLTQPKNKVKHDLQATSCPNLKDIPYFRGLGSLLYRKQTTRNSTEFFPEPLMETLPPPERATCDTHPEHPMPRRYEEVCEDVDERPEAPACGNHPLQPPFDRVAGLFQGVASQQAHLRRQNGPSVHSTRKKKNPYKWPSVHQVNVPYSVISKRAHHHHHRAHISADQLVYTPHPKTC